MMDDYTYNQLIETTWSSNNNGFLCAYITHIDRITGLLTVEKDTDNGEVVCVMTLDELEDNYQNISGDDVQW